MLNPATTLDVLRRIGEGEYVEIRAAPVAEFQILRELKASDYIVGQIGPDSPGAPPTTVECVHFTTEGRLLWEKLAKETRQAQRETILLRGLCLVAGFVAGTLGPVLAEFWEWLLLPP